MLKRTSVRFIALDKDPSSLLLALWLALANKLHVEAFLVERQRNCRLLLLIGNDAAVLRRHGGDWGVKE